MIITPAVPKRRSHTRMEMQFFEHSSHIYKSNTNVRVRSGAFESKDAHSISMNDFVGYALAGQVKRMLWYNCAALRVLSVSRVLWEFLSYSAFFLSECCMSTSTSLSLQNLFSFDYAVPAEAVLEGASTLRACLRMIFSCIFASGTTMETSVDTFLCNPGLYARFILCFICTEIIKQTAALFRAQRHLSR